MFVALITLKYLLYVSTHFHTIRFENGFITLKLLFKVSENYFQELTFTR